jgi:uncharacterized protein YndB with AHSA1/START domain
VQLVGCASVEAMATSNPATSIPATSNPSDLDGPTVQREVDVDLPADDVWPLVGDADGWAEWLVERADVVVEPGQKGTVVDDGQPRRVHIGEVEPGRSVTWSWWPAERPRDASTVRIVVVPAGVTTRLRITETRASASALAQSRWNARTTLLAARAHPVAMLVAA